MSKHYTITVKGLEVQINYDANVSSHAPHWHALQQKSQHKHYDYF